MKKLFKNKTIFISGSTGSWGTELTKQLLEFRPKEIRMFSRGEYAQVKSKRLFNNNSRLKYIIGDVRDFKSVDKACKGVDFIFHLAALKHVPICEEQSDEAIKTNIIGTQNIVEAALKNKVDKVIDVSTDKACQPFNVYGITKALGEHIIQEAGRNSDTTKFIVIRGGNALGSNGSVVPLFIDKIKRDNIIPVTSPEMTRYFLTLPEAVSLLFTAATCDISGALFVMNMPSCKITDLAKVLAEYYGNKYTKIKLIGIREGEKIHEMLLSEHEAPKAYEYNNKYFIVMPNTSDIYSGKKVTFKKFTSNDKLMSLAEIRSMLDKGGFLKC
ncbi:hypothetical protein LCGC14_0306150 [marine sediment metagenome]|uniref:Polysaccharide biosynthesis protein CapD-like domain-containing protein n=1 Tax=marine sediment metagenome TaxID=412755 RepID=A0A0F9WAQ4_9ZZZZ